MPIQSNADFVELIRHIPRLYLASADWAVYDPGGMVSVAMADDANESRVTLLGGIAGAVIYSKPLVDVFGKPCDCTRPMAHHGIVEAVTDAPFDASTIVAVGIAEIANLTTGLYNGSGLQWFSVAGQCKGYCESNAATNYSIALAPGVQDAKSHGFMGSSSSAPTWPAIYTRIARRSTDANLGGTNLTGQAVLGAYVYVAFRRSGAAGNATVGVKAGIRNVPHVTGGFYAG